MHDQLIGFVTTAGAVPMQTCKARNEVANMAYLLLIKKKKEYSCSVSEKVSIAKGEDYYLYMLLSIKHIYCKIVYYCHIKKINLAVAYVELYII
jgi:hypothetical protein